MDRPNVLLIVLDTARADAFEPYGAPSGATPAIAQLARAGGAHPRAYAPACWTVPSHVSMFSGRLPRAAGITDVRGGTAPLYRAVMHGQRGRLLPEVLQGSGYRTIGLSANSWIHEASGFDVGFDEFRHFPTTRVHAIGSDDPKARVRWYLQAWRARADDGASAIEAALAQQARDRSAPFFWFVNLMECHSPYLPPRPFSRLDALGRLRCAREARKHLTLESIWMQSIGGFRLSDGAIERMRLQYAGAITQMDAWIGRVLELLDRAGVLESTIVIVTSDHGENLGDGRLLGHAFSLDDRLIRVPFVYAGPLSFSGSSAGLMTLPQLPRLVAEAVGLRSHPWMDEPHAPGVAVAQLDPPARGDDPRLDGLLDKWHLGDEARDRFSTAFTCATDGVVKLIRRAGTEQLVVLADDPLELAPIPLERDVPAAHVDAVATLRAALDDAEAQEHPAPNPDAAPLEPGEIDALEEQLRQLGYL